MGGQGSGSQLAKLISWKEIADYLGRDVRTVRRWEEERGLPVHRGPEGKGYTVFAYTQELDVWLHRDGGPEKSQPVAPEVPRGAAAGEVALPKSVKAEPKITGGRLALILVLAVVVVVAAYFAPHLFNPPSKPQAGRTMLAVLPFANLSGDPKQEYFSDGLTEELISELAGLNPERLGVIARTSAMVYKTAPKSIRQIGRELGVEYVLEGSVLRRDSRARVIAQLIRVSDQTHVWAGSYERTTGDIYALEEEVARAIASEIRIGLGPKSEHY